MAAPSQTDLQAGVPAGANIVARVPAPSGKGELLLDANGGVYDTGGQSFSGSYFSLKPEDRQGTRQFTNIVVDPNTGGYKLVSDQPGQEYNFGPSQYVQGMPKANPLYSDPAFLQFAANAGLDYETAVQDVGRKQAALNNALALKVPALQEQGKQDLQGVYNNYAARGLYGSGQQAADEGKVQANNLAQMGAAQAETQNQIADLQSTLASKRQQYMQQAAEKGLGTAGQQDLTSRLNAVDQKYPLGKNTGAI